MLLQLPDDRIVWTPHPIEGIYEFTGRAKLDKLLSGFVLREVLRPRADAILSVAFGASVKAA